MSIERVALVVHDGKPRSEEILADIQRHLADRVEIVKEDPDLVVSIGGDGTMLRAAQLAHGCDALLFGVNLGTLGYLSEVDADEAADALEEVVRGEHSIEERMMLACEVYNGDVLVSSNVGLNEVLVERSARHRLVRLSVRIGGEGLAAFNADGIIVATPTGSTAYALSAGGPIVSPRAECLIVVPVSPHMIFSRPFVLAPDEPVEVRLDGEDMTAEVTLDGAISTPIGSGWSAVITRHQRPLRLVRLAGPNFLSRLRAKLGLPA